MSAPHEAQHVVVYALDPDLDARDTQPAQLADDVFVDLIGPGFDAEADDAVLR